MSGHEFVNYPRYMRGTVYSSTALQLTSSIKENPRLRAAAEELKKTGVKVGDAVSEALKTMEESEIMRAVCPFLPSIPRPRVDVQADLKSFCSGFFNYRKIYRTDTEDSSIQISLGNSGRRSR